MSDAETDRQMAALTTAILKAIAEQPEPDAADVYDALLFVADMYSGDPDDAEGGDYDYGDGTNYAEGGNFDDPGGEA